MPLSTAPGGQLLYMEHVVVAKQADITCVTKATTVEVMSRDSAARYIACRRRGMTGEGSPHSGEIGCEVD